MQLNFSGSPAPMQQEYHAARNARTNLKKIKHENARLFVQLNKQSC